MGFGGRDRSNGFCGGLVGCTEMSWPGVGVCGLGLGVVVACWVCLLSRVGGCKGLGEGVGCAKRSDLSKECLKASYRSGGRAGMLRSSRTPLKMSLLCRKCSSAGRAGVASGVAKSLVGIPSWVVATAYSWRSLRFRDVTIELNSSRLDRKSLARSAGPTSVIASVAATSVFGENGMSRGLVSLVRDEIIGRRG